MSDRVPERRAAGTAALPAVAIGWTALADAAVAATLTTQPACGGDGDSAWLPLTLSAAWVGGLTLFVKE